ncbi:MAG: DUF2220 domain-containing protein [Epsilonproteobacteria bacterium]|nr:DUF2220 domain-containing protein [Campylobacterota bacterium]
MVVWVFVLDCNQKINNPLQPSSLFEALKENQYGDSLRIEQERIPLEYLLMRL